MEGVIGSDDNRSALSGSATTLRSTTMSLQVNFSSPDITKAYQDVLNARILTYEKASNDLRVQSTGNGLEDLEEEISDGR